MVEGDIEGFKNILTEITTEKFSTFSERNECPDKGVI